MKSFILLAALVAGFVTVDANASSCREGSEEIFQEANGDQTENVWYVCRNGRFIKKFGHVEAPKPTYPSCREGKVESFLESQGDDSVLVTYVCRSGRFVPLYN